jgi:hypothetical protein
MIDPAGPEGRVQERAVLARWRGDAGYAVTVDGHTRVLVFGLLHVEVIAEGDRLRGRLTGWGRDVSRYLTPSDSVAATELPELLDRIDAAIRAVVPADYLRRQAAATPSRAVGDPPEVPLIGLARIREGMQRTWPDAALEERDGGFAARPYDSTPVVLGITEHPLTMLSAAVLVDGFPLGSLFRATMSKSLTERGLETALGMMDEWLRLSLPSRDVLALPITEEDPRG